MQAHFADLWEMAADVAAADPAVSRGSTQLTWAAYEARAARVASLLDQSGIGRDGKVAIMLFNGHEYLEVQFAAFKQRAIPVNVNYRYRADELAYILDNSDAEALFFDAAFAPYVARIRDQLPRLRLLVQVDEPGAAAELLPGAHDYEATLAEHDRLPPLARSADDTYLLYTGGTTGLPKGVMYRMGDITLGLLRQGSAVFGIPPVDDLEDLRAVVARFTTCGDLPAVLCTPPLMHGAGDWLGAMVPHMVGGNSVLLESRTFDADEALAAVERHAVSTMVIVGDAFGRPIVEALDRPDTTPDLGSVRYLVSGGAMLAADTKDALLRHLPGAVIVDALGSSEGGMGVQVTKHGDRTPTGSFRLSERSKVIREDGSLVPPGTGEIGMLASAGEVMALGYYKDPEKTERTFRLIDGVRHLVSGDMATVDADGTIRLLGRGSGCINSGGEKIFPEEVEEVVKTHPHVRDCLVFGVADERFGERIVAVASTRPGHRVGQAALIAHVKATLASYKAPRSVLLVDEVPRASNGKADYATARALFESAARAR
jgi:acyl-CoA synthetase (AMP-forming)/AMP-acid ligase II